MKYPAPSLTIPAPVWVTATTANGALSHLYWFEATDDAMAFMAKRSEYTLKFIGSIDAEENVEMLKVATAFNAFAVERGFEPFDDLGWTPGASTNLDLFTVFSAIYQPYSPDTQKTLAKWESLGYAPKWGHRAIKQETDLPHFPLMMWKFSQMEKKSKN